MHASTDPPLRIFTRCHAVHSASLTDSRPRPVVGEPCCFPGRLLLGKGLPAALAGGGVGRSRPRRGFCRPAPPGHPRPGLPGRRDPRLQPGEPPGSPAAAGAAARFRQGALVSFVLFVLFSFAAGVAVSHSRRPPQRAPGHAPYSSVPLRRLGWSNFSLGRAGSPSPRPPRGRQNAPRRPPRHFGALRPPASSP